MTGKRLTATLFCLTFLLATAQTLSPPSAHALTPDEIRQGGEQSERIQREEQERQLRQLEKDRSSVKPPTVLQPETPERPAVEGPETCRDIREISLTGVTLLSDSERERLVAPYIGRCLGVAEIERLLGDIVYLYMKKGYIAARAYLPRQDLSSGKLEVLVVEGRLENILIEDGDKDSISRRAVFPWVIGKPLNIRDIEQGLDQINRLQSNNAAISIEPGKAPGGSVLVVRNEPNKPWKLYVSFDSHGSRSTGREQAGVTIGYDNLLGINDYLGVTDRRTMNRKMDNSKPLWRDSGSDSVVYSIPCGYHTVTLGGGYSTYASTLTTPSGVRLKSNGDSELFNLRLGHVIYRDRKNLLTLSETLTRKSSRNFLADQYLAVSSRRLTVFDADLDLRTSLAGGIFSVGAGYAGGLRWFDALDDPDGLSANAPKAQFGKIRYSASWLRPFELLDKQFTFSSQFAGQHAFDVLYGSEQMLVGSLYTVRGFSDESIASDNGWYLRNELSARLPFSLGGVRCYARPHIGVDTGRVTGHTDVGQTGGITGASAGMALKVGSAFMEFLYTKPLSQPDWFNGGYGERIFARLVIEI